MLKLKNFTLPGLILLSLSLPLAGQTFRSRDAEGLVKDSKLVRLNPRNKNIKFIQLRDDANVDDKDQATWLGKALKTSQNHGFRATSKSTDQLGYTHTKYQIQFKNLQIEGAIYNVHSKAGKILSANGDYTSGNDLNVIPLLSESLAFEKAIKYVNAKQYRWENDKSERPKGILVILPVDEKYVLAYKYDIYAIIPLSRQYIFIDANSGNVLKTLNRIQEDNATGTAETMYSGIVSITTDSYSGSFRLSETGRGGGIETYDMNKGRDISNAVDFTDNDNYWSTSADFDKAACDAHYAVELTYDYYYQKFSRNSYDNLGTKLKSYVHYDVNYSNAFWDGNYMYFGDGNGASNLPFTPIDIVAHEYSHGVTEKSAGLVYEDESGALNESFSDIFAVTIDFNKNPSSANYQIGEVNSVTHTPFRDMSNPNAYRNPDTYKGLYWDKKQEVHCNSGVQDFWYYLLCEGGTGTNDIGNAYHINGIGRDKAVQIAYRNLTVYLTPNSNYDDARFNSIQSAKDLFGNCSAEAAAVAAAWYAVGIGDANDCLSPENFTASLAGRSQITLSWKKNLNNDDILLAYSTLKNLGNPDDGTVYIPGNTIPGGGVVIYSGSATTFNHTGLKSGTKYYYKAWSIKSENSYSGGVTATVIPPGIDAGKDKKIVLPLKSEVSVSGTYQEGLVYDSLIFKWEKMNGKGSVTFNNPSSLNTIAHFNEVGKYTLQLSMSCYGLLSIDTMHVFVSLTDSITNHVISGYHNWMGLEVKDNYAYLADLVYGFRIMDISDYLKPIEISGYSLFNVKHVHAEGDYVYINQNFGGGLTILNIKDKYKPSFVGYFDVPNSKENEDFIVKNGIVYFTSIPDGLIIIDATNPADPVKIGGFSCSPANISLIDNYLFISERVIPGIFSMSPFILDISDPRNPKKVSMFPNIRAEYLAPSAIQGEFMYRCELRSNDIFYFCIYDISNRLDPILRGSTEISWNNASISVQGNYAYLNDGLRVIDISDKSNPVEVSNEYISFDQVSATKNIIYSTRGEAFVVYKSYLSNRAPYVYAGIDRSIDSISSILHGEVFDEGLPEGADISSSWSKTSGPGNVSFSDFQSLNSSISFSDTGKYVIRLSGTDGELYSFDEVRYYVPFTISKQPVDQSSCLNTQVDFTVEVKSKTPVSYKWYKNNIPLNDGGKISGTSTERLIISNATIQDKGKYYCLITYGKCFKSNMAELIVQEIPAKPVITFNTGVLNSSATNGNQWYFNSQPLQNAVNQNLIAESDGDYFVVVKLNGCSSQPSNIISCTSTGIWDEEIESGINVYPNPASDIVNIAITNKFDSDFIVDVYDIMGIILKTMKKSSSETLFDVDFSKYSAGYYIMRIYNKHKNYQVKVVKK